MVFQGQGGFLAVGTWKWPWNTILPYYVYCFREAFYQLGDCFISNGGDVINVLQISLLFTIVLFWLFWGLNSSWFPYFFSLSVRLLLRILRVVQWTWRRRSLPPCGCWGIKKHSVVWPIVSEWAKVRCISVWCQSAMHSMLFKDDSFSGLLPQNNERLPRLSKTRKDSQVLLVASTVPTSR